MSKSNAKQMGRRVNGAALRYMLLWVALTLSGVSYAAGAAGARADGRAAFFPLGYHTSTSAPMVMTDDVTPTINVAEDYASETLTFSLTPATEGYVFYYTTDGTTPTTDGTTPSISATATNSEISVTLAENVFEATDGTISVSSLSDGAVVSVIAVNMTASGSTVTTHTSNTTSYTIQRYSAPTVTANYTALTDPPSPSPTPTPPTPTPPTPTPPTTLPSSAMPSAAVLYPPPPIPKLPHPPYLSVTTTPNTISGSLAKICFPPPPSPSAPTATTSPPSWTMCPIRVPVQHKAK